MYTEKFYVGNSFLSCEMGKCRMKFLFLVRQGNGCLSFWVFCFFFVLFLMLLMIWKHECFILCVWLGGGVEPLGRACLAIEQQTY